MRGMVDRVRRLWRLRPNVMAAVLLGFFALLCVSGALHDSVTIDEFVIVPAGYAKLRYFGQVNWLNPNNPPLFQLLLGLPCVALKCALPAAWIQKESPELRWALGTMFMKENGGIYLQVFLWARLITVACALLLGLGVYRFSTELFGQRGGLVSLALFCTCPNLIAHGHLATVDMGLTTFLFLTSYFLYRAWRGWQEGAPFRLRSALPLSACISAALLTKFTALFFLPMYLVLALYLALRPRGSGLRLRALGLYAVTAILFFLFLSACLYRGEGVLDPLGFDQYQSAPFRALAGGWREVLPNPLPRWYLRGMDEERTRFETGRIVFFYRGEITSTKSRTSFVLSFLLKTPLPTLLLVAAALGLALRRPRRDLLHVILPAGYAVFLFSFVIGSNIALRYILPAYPFLFTTAGILASSAPQCRRPWYVAVPVLLLLSLCSAIETAPRFLSYFNAVAGGPAGGRNYLSDSNFDWGQDLRDLRKRMTELGIERIYLSYHGLVDPQLYGIEFTPLSEKKGPGFIAISAHHLHGLSAFVPLPMDKIEPLQHKVPMALAGDTIFLFAE